MTGGPGVGGRTIIWGEIMMGTTGRGARHPEGGPFEFDADIEEGAVSRSWMGKENGAKAHRLLGHGRAVMRAHCGGCAAK